MVVKYYNHAWETGIQKWVIPYIHERVIPCIHAWMGNTQYPINGYNSAFPLFFYNGNCLISTLNHNYNWFRKKIPVGVHSHFPPKNYDFLSLVFNTDLQIFVYYASVLACGLNFNIINFCLLTEFTIIIIYGMDI